MTGSVTRAGARLATTAAQGAAPAEGGPLGPAVGTSATDRLQRVVLDGAAMTRLSPMQEADRAQAIADLEVENSFAPVIRKHAGEGPFVLYLSMLDGRLLFDIRTATDAPVAAIGLALGPFRGLVKDYQLLVDSYVTAVEEGREARIQAIDMGRRGLHNEGARLITDRLAGKVVLDFDTARRLFTLVCVLHQRL